MCSLGAIFDGVDTPSVLRCTFHRVDDMHSDSAEHMSTSGYGKQPTHNPSKTNAFPVRTIDCAAYALTFMIAPLFKTHNLLRNTHLCEVYMD